MSRHSLTIIPSSGLQMFALETLRDIDHLVVGATILGTGGGGDPKAGRETLNADLTAGRKLKIVQLNELPGESLVVSPYYVGAMSGSAGLEQKKVIANPFEVGIEVIEKHLQRKVAATLACEIGGGNTAAALHLAAQLGVPLVDGDLTGRAGPEIHQNTANLFDAPMAPSAIVSDSGNVVFIESYGSIDDYEALARYVSVLARGYVAVIDTPLTPRLASQLLVVGTISESVNLGRAVREAHEQSRDALEAVRKTLGGWILFQGYVENYNRRDEKGFLIGEVTLKGTNAWRGRKFRSWIKNEHLFAWRDGKPVVMPPDLIIFLDAQGHGVTNDTLRQDQEVSVLAAKAPAVWRTLKGLELFGPQHFGLEYDYVPVEELNK